ncbi:MAG: hypothetical protein WAL98_04205 [Desulfatiglandaceae bacterium]|jgi:hypothetical protein
MKFTKNWQKNLNRTLRVAYHEKEKVEVGGQWQAKVMHSVRDIHRLLAKKSFFEQIGDALWRFAPVACALILILGICILKFHMIPDYEMAKIMANDPVEYGLLQSLLM